MGRAMTLPVVHRARAARQNFDFDDLDLIVDLGDRIGTLRWWQGLATVTLLTTAMLFLGARITPLPVPTHPGFVHAEYEQVAALAIAPIRQNSTTGHRLAPTKAAVRLSAPPERPRIEATAKLRAVDSFGGALRRVGVSAADIARASSLIAPAADVRKLKPGTSFDVVLGRRPDKASPRPLDHLAFRAAFDLKLELYRDPAGALTLKRIPIAVDDTPLRVTGQVGGSLYRAARAAGLPGKTVSAFIRELGHAIDFQRDVGASDRFDIVVEHRRAATGETETGNLLYGAIDGKKKIEMMRWTTGGRTAYFKADGSGLKRGLMRTPVDGARMSSGFGMRLHPILGYSRLHKGVDFSAGTGTPIMAAADGTIVFAGVNRGYGNHTRIRHANGIETSYSHMSRFAKNARTGAKVSQGQVIGYVGSTGLSTGPHLHYEVYMRGKAVNPQSAKLPIGTQLGGGELSRFKNEMARLRNLKATGTADSVADSNAKAKERAAAARR